MLTLEFPLNSRQYNDLIPPTSLSAKEEFCPSVVL